MWRFKRVRFNSWLMAMLAFAFWALSMDYLWTHVVINNCVLSGAGRISHLIREHGSEIPVFGTSKVTEDYDPEILGDDVFNYGMPGASDLDVTIALMHIECNKHKQTPIILDLPHNVFHGTGDPSKFAPFAWRPEMREMMERLGVMEWRYWVPGLRYFGYYDWYLRSYLGENASRSATVVRGYTVPLDQPFDRRVLDKDIGTWLKKGFGYKEDPEQDHRFFDLIRSAPHRKFVLVISPVHPLCLANFQNPAGFAMYLDKLRSFTNVVLLDFGRMELTDDCFQDAVHLNKKGARKFSRQLAEQLRIIRTTAISNAQISGGYGAE